MTNILEICELKAWYGATQALFNVNLSIKQGEVVSLMGRNGMGKSTTVNSICGLIAKKKGAIDFNDVSIIDLPSYKTARLGVGLVPEGRRIFPSLTVLENLTAAARPGPWDLRRVYNFFPRLEERSSQLSNTLSGGEQQMLVIGRALMTNPKLLILDEATEGLAPVIRQEIWAAMRSLKEEGMSILIVDKTLKELLTLADNCFILERGETVWSGRPLDLNSDVADKYLGV